MNDGERQSSGDVAEQLSFDPGRLLKGGVYRITVQVGNERPGRYIEGIYRGRVMYREVPQLVFESTWGLMYHLIDPDFVSDCEEVKKRWFL